jgi:hypothetical protein
MGGLDIITAGFWVYIKGVCPPKDFGLESMKFSMVSSKERGAGCTMVI